MDKGAALRLIEELKREGINASLSGGGEELLLSFPTGKAFFIRPIFGWNRSRPSLFIHEPAFDSGIPEEVLETMDDLVDAMRPQTKIERVKTVRRVTGLTLKNSLFIVERLFSRNGTGPSVEGSLIALLSRLMEKE